ncbi:MAG: hypothetical protein KF703_18910, partial [Actinobacteria bacterium]|nr:hypothetical protein [Actinomycetota bacterium]
AVGQSWYLAAGSIGLAVVGLAVAVRVLRGRAVDADADRRSDAGARFAVGLVLAVAASVFATSVLFFAQNQFRADHWVYGRHNDSFTPLLVALGVASLLSARSWRRRLVDLAAGAVVIAATGIVVVVARDPRDLGNDLSAFAVPAIVRWARTDPAGVFGRATIVGLAGVLALGAAFVAAPVLLGHGGPETIGADSAQNLRQRRRGRMRRAGAAGVVAVLAAWSVWVGSAAAQVTHDFQSVNAEGWHLPEQVVDLDIGTLAIEERVAKSLPTLTYPFALPGVDVTTYSAARGEDPGGPFVVARLDDVDRLAEGDRAVLLDEGGWYGFFGAPLGLAVWVRPGPEQDRLAADGRLLPATFPGPLPTSALRVEVRVADPGARLEVAPGGWVDVPVAGRHQGTGAPWPDQASYGLDHRVQVQAHPGDSSTSAAIWVASGELDRWVVPGGRFRAVVRLHAVDESGVPLPPGRYEAVLGVAQAGGAFFAPARNPGATVEVVVR